MTSERDLVVATTKLRPPPPPGRFVPRSRLDDILDAGLDTHARLLLVSAAAGSGKSTLLATWAAGRPDAVAWLQVEPSDSDPTRFWSFLIETICRVRPIDTANLTPLVIGSNGDDLVVVTALVNALAADPGPLLVIVDDYHVVDDASVHRGVERLIDLCPPQVTIVLGTRFDPPFRLGRLRVRNHLAEVRAADLRFDSAEASDLLAAGGHDLEPDHVVRLCDRTEGWAAGLVLAGLALGRNGEPSALIDGFGGGDQLVVKYLRDELLAALDPAEVQRLLATSVLDQLSGPLVDAVTGDTDGTAWLRSTAADNQLLIALDRTGTWFRYHHLLRDLLRLEAERAIPHLIPALNARAAEWFEDHGDTGAAIAHRLAAGDPGAAGQLMYLYGPALLAAGQVDTLRSILEQLGDTARTITWCALLYGWCEYVAGRHASAQTWLDALDAAAETEFPQVVAAPLRMNLSLARGEVGAALDSARMLAAAGHLATPRCDLTSVVGATFAWAGLHDEARPTLLRAVDQSIEEGFLSAHVLALVHLAVVEVDGGTPAEARAAAALAIEVAQGFGLGEYHGMAPAYAIRARTCGEPDAARRDARLALDLARRASCVDPARFVPRPHVVRRRPSRPRRPSREAAARRRTRRDRSLPRSRHRCSASGSRRIAPRSRRSHGRGRGRSTHRP